MNRNNDVFKVLVTTGDQDLLATGQNLDALALGQVGIFDAKTNLSVDETDTPPQSLYFAVGVDRDGDGVKDDVDVSAGQFIQTKNTKALSFRPHTASRPQILDIETFENVPCETDFTIRVEYRNQEILRRIGFNQFSRAFSIKTGCDDCTAGVSNDENEVQKALIEAINAQEDGLITASAYAYQGNVTVTGAGPTADGNITVTIGTTDVVVAVLNADDADATAVKIAAAINTDGTYDASVTGAVVTITGATTDAVSVDAAATGTTTTVANLAKTTVSDVSAFETSFPDSAIGVRLTTVELSKSNFSNVNLTYYHPRQTSIIVSLVDGFDCTNTTVTEVQSAANEEGNGYDIKQKEYHSQLDGNGPYVTSEVTGVAKQRKFFASEDEEYDQFIIESEFISDSGWKKYSSPISTIIAVPGASTTTRGALVAAIDVLFADLGFDTLASDAAAANVDPAVVELTTDKDNYANDGIA